MVSFSVLDSFIVVIFEMMRRVTVDHSFIYYYYYFILATAMEKDYYQSPIYDK